MRHLLPLLIVLSVVASASAAESASDVVLAYGGKSKFVIVLPANAGETVQFAAEELQRYLKEISGATLPIVTEAPHSRRTIVLRESPRPDGRFALPDVEEPFDGYTVALGARSAEIVGQSPRGVLYGVYEMLERLGCRWFYPRHDPKDPEVVPKREYLAIAAFRYAVDAPPAMRTFVIRDTDADPEAMALRDVDWAAKARYNAVQYERFWLDENRNLVSGPPTGKVAEVLRAIRRRGLRTFGVEHLFRYFLPGDQYFDAHPEWFGMLKGKRVPQRSPGGGAQFCWSNPEAVETFVDNVAAWVETGVPLDFLKIGAEDGRPACDCDRCRTRNPSDWYQQIANRIAERLAVLKPKVLVLSPLGYPPLKVPPKSTRPHPRLHAMYEHWGRDHSISLDDPRYPTATVDQWVAATEGRLSVLLYYGGLITSPPVPPPYTKTFAGDRAFMLRRTPEGFFAIQFPERTWWTTGFNNYLMGVAGFDTRLDTDAVLDDYCRRYFGPAGAPLLNYYRALAGDVALSYSLTRAVRVAPEIRAVEHNRLRGLGRFLDEAQQAAAGRTPYDYRVSKALAVHQYLASLAQSRDDRGTLMTALEARKAGKPGLSQEEIDRIIATEEGLVAVDQKRAETMPPGTFDPLMGWITGRSLALAGLKRSLAGQKPAFKEPAERTAEDGAQFIEQQPKP